MHHSERCMGPIEEMESRAEAGSLFNEKVDELYSSLSPRERTRFIIDALARDEPELWRSIQYVRSRGLDALKLAKAWVEKNKGKVVYRALMAPRTYNASYRPEDQEDDGHPD